ncbi:MAG: FixH family protein [Spirochaetia bacterium]|nr:FixH family protein [Spirochaetia bacterium]
MNTKLELKKDLKSPWLLGILGTVLIAVIANIVLIFMSFNHPHSLVSKDYYEKGKEYFHTQADQKKAVKLLGYKLNLVVPEKPKVNVEEIIHLKVLDQKGNIVQSGEATLFVYRVDDTSKDFKINLHQDSHGEFVSRIKFPFPGTWDLIAQLTFAGEKLDVAERIFVEK